MSNELVTYEDKQQQVAFYSVRNMDYDAIEAKMDEEASSGNRFPGDALTHDGKRGKWKWGFGKKGVAFDHKQMSFVFNIPNAVEGWQKFVDNRPVFGPMVYICSKDKLPERDSLGDTDDRFWPVNEKGEKQDPWKRYIVCPIRVDGDAKVNHLSISTFWGVIKFKDLVKSFAKEGRNNPGKLPVVNIDTEVRERKDNKSETFDVPTFQIVAWDEPTAADEPEGAVTVPQQTAIPDANVTTTQRDASTVEKLQEQANQTAKAEEGRRQQTVEKIAANAGAAPAGRRRGDTPPAAGSIFAGNPASRQRQRPTLVS